MKMILILHLSIIFQSICYMQNPSNLIIQHKILIDDGDQINPKNIEPFNQNKFVLHQKYGVNDKTSYLFDYLDKLLKDEAIQDFTQIIESIKRLLNTKIINISLVDLGKIIKSANWEEPSNLLKLFNHFDINNNNSLDIKEILLLSISINKSELGNDDKSLFYSNFVNSVRIYFPFCKISSIQQITAELIWNSLKSLRTSSNQLCDIFQCDDLRTDSVNEFVLNNSQHTNEDNKSYLTKEEFYYGLLLGFIHRQVFFNTISTSDSFTNKSSRWLNNRDIECERISILKNNIK